LTLPTKYLSVEKIKENEIGGVNGMGGGEERKLKGVSGKT
jgi:hypothetical protein